MTESVEVTAEEFSRDLSQRELLGAMGRARRAWGAQSARARADGRGRPPRARGHRVTLSLPMNTDGRGGQPGARSSLHDDHGHERRARAAAVRQGLRGRRLPQRRPHAHRRALPRRLQGVPLQRDSGQRRDCRRRRRPIRSRSSRTAWSPEASCSTSPVSADCALARSRPARLSRRARGGRARAGRHRRRGRRAPRTHRSLPPPKRARAVA